MTPKEKARELYDKYWLIVDTKSVNKCALIAVYEIIFALNDDIYIQGETDIDSHREYWEEVRQEIEKL